MVRARTGAERALALDERIERFAIDELHGVKPRVAFRAEVKDRGHMPVAQLRGGAGLAHETLPGDLAVEVGRVDDLERHRDPQAGVKRLVGDAHRAPAQLEKRAVVAGQNFVMIEDWRSRA